MVLNLPCYGYTKLTDITLYRCYIADLYGLVRIKIKRVGLQLALLILQVEKNNR